MSTHTEAWYVGERAENLAIVALTGLRDLDIRVEKAPSDIGLDLLVYLKQKGNAASRFFGVEVKGVRNGSTALESTEFARVTEMPFPVCLFVFDVESEEGKFAWICEPTRDAQGRKSVRPVEQLELEALSEARLKQTVNEVEHWYSSKN